MESKGHATTEHRAVAKAPRRLAEATPPWSPRKAQVISVWTRTWPDFKTVAICSQCVISGAVPGRMSEKKISRRPVSPTGGLLFLCTPAGACEHIYRPPAADCLPTPTVVAPLEPICRVAALTRCAHRISLHPHSLSCSTVETLFFGQGRKKNARRPAGSVRGTCA